MSVPTVVVIPTKDRRVDSLPALVTELLVQHEAAEILVMDNSDEQDADEYLMIDRSLHVVNCAWLPLYRMWNDGWRKALELHPNGAVNVAFLNDDLMIPDAFLSTLAGVLREDDALWAVSPTPQLTCADEPDVIEVTRVRGTYRDGGILGWAFLIRGELARDGLIPFVDEDFKWWCGDDDLIRQIELAGGELARVNIGVDHEGEGTARHYRNWVESTKLADMELFKAKYA